MIVIIIIISIIVSFFLGIAFGSNKRKDLEIENNLLTNQITNYREHYKNLDIKVLDDDIELDKMMEELNDKELD